MRVTYGWEMWCPKCGTRYIVRTPYPEQKPDAHQCDRCRNYEWAVDWTGQSRKYDIGGVPLTEERPFFEPATVRAS